MADDFDFIIVGGGTAGCLLASVLSKAPKRPLVLLVEAGSDGLDFNHRKPSQRFSNAFTRPDLDQGYSTVPQHGLNNRVIPYQRGLGLGGSSLINFMVYTRGPSADWDRWAHLVGDEDWNWEAAKRRFCRFESSHDEVDKINEKYLSPDPVNHGYHGDLHITVPGKDLGVDVPITINAAVEAGFRKFPINLDCNSGDIMGASIGYASLHREGRNSAERAFLEDKAGNLTIWTKTRVSNILFDDKVAVGIKTIDGKKAFSSGETILCAGSIDTPKLLLLSGIGPFEDLEKVGTRLVHDLPGVGQSASDHLAVIITHLMDQSFSPKIEHALDTGPCPILIFGKDAETYETNAFKALDGGQKSFIEHPGIPNFEIATSGPLIPPTYPMPKESSFASNVTVMMNPQSKGTITLQSNNPLDLPLIDPAYLTNPYDKKVLVAAIKAENRLMNTKEMRQHYKAPINAPSSDSDADIEAFILDNAGPLWHFSSTAKMGTRSAESAVVNSELKVFGVQNLRVADISVCPFNPNAHTQAIAYLIAQTAAEKIIVEHKLNISH